MKFKVNFYDKPGDDEEYEAEVVEQIERQGMRYFLPVIPGYNILEGRDGSITAIPVGRFG